MLLKERIESFLLANSKLARLDARVVHTQEGVHVIHRLCTDIGKLLNFGSSILNLQSIKTMSTIKRGYRTNRNQTSSSLRERPSCSTRDLTAFQPVRRCLDQMISQCMYINLSFAVCITDPMDT